MGLTLKYGLKISASIICHPVSKTKFSIFNFSFVSFLWCHVRKTWWSLSL